jgi:NADPH:quinone reductase
MRQTMQKTMRAVALDRFGGIETLQVREIPVPEVGPDQVLIRVESAGVGEWDPFEREGGYAQMLGVEADFPYVLGSEGAGVVVVLGDRVGRFKKGESVYACGFLNPKGGFYAEYAAVEAGYVSHVPAGLTTAQAGAMSGVAITALRGLDDTLALKQGESLMIFGAGGGVGHVAVQLAKRMGARVLAVASGDDGVALVDRLGADAAANGRTDDVLAAARKFAPGGLDAALLTAGGEVAEEALHAVRDGGRVAYPYGIRPEPQPRSGVRFSGYYGAPDSEIIGRLDRLIGAGPFEVHVAQTFPLGYAADAHRALNDHYLGKLALLSG